MSSIIFFSLLPKTLLIAKKLIKKIIDNNCKNTVILASLSPLTSYLEKTEERGNKDELEGKKELGTGQGGKARVSHTCMSVVHYDHALWCDVVVFEAKC